MPDFTSSLYLGLTHAYGSLASWPSLTTGVPAVLRQARGSDDVGRALAAHIGAERALLYPSTLHAFIDLIAVLARDDVEIVLDAGTYPVAAWAVERAVACGASACVAHDVAAAVDRVPRRPVVVMDGFRPGHDRQPSLRRRLESVRNRGGLLVLDDTQALGIFGRPDARSAYGVGGGGSLRHAGESVTDAVVVASLAKAFGAPVAVVAGSERLVARLAREGETRVHSSPPSAAAVSAASSALHANARVGEALRSKLLLSVQRLRSGVRKHGLELRGGVFPFQTVVLEPESAHAAHVQLAQRGVSSVLHADARGSARLSLLVNATHTAAEIDAAVAALVEGR